MKDDEIYEYLGQTFEWSATKARKTYMARRILFTDAATVFFDEGAVYYKDEDHSDGEDRYIVIGYSQRARELFVVHVLRGERTRIISARAVTPRERSEYEFELRR